MNDRCETIEAQVAGWLAKIAIWIACGVLGGWIYDRFFNQ